MSKSLLEKLFAEHLSEITAEEWETQYKFCPTRRWLFDFAFTNIGLAIEIDGGTWSAGRHTRGSGFEKDCEKLNEASILGWMVLRFTGGMVRDGRAKETTRRALEILGLDPEGPMEMKE